MRTLAVVLFAILPVFLLGQTVKKPLSPADFNHWNVLNGTQISTDGNWISYAVKQQVGDGHVLITNGDGERVLDIPRGDALKFHPQGTFAVCKIKASYEETREAKLAKKKKDKMPKDSLGIWLAGNRDIQKIGRVKSFKIATKTEGVASTWIAYHMEKALPAPKDTASQDSTGMKSGKPAKKKKSSAKKKSSKATLLVLQEVMSGDTVQIPGVKSYNMSPDGSWISALQTFGDSIDSVKIRVFHTANRQLQEVYKAQGVAKDPVFSKNGAQMAFLASTDTAKVKSYALFHQQLNTDSYQKVVAPNTPGMPAGWGPSEHGRVYFSEQGTRLFLGTALIPEQEPKDTLTEEEKYHVDVWNWKDLRLQPMQKVNLDRDKKRSYLAVFHTASGNFRQLGSEDLQRVVTTDKGEGEWALGYDRQPYLRASSWSYPSKQDVYLVNVNTGQKELVREGSQYTYAISPTGKHLTWYDIEDKSWYGMSIATRSPKNLTGKLKVNFYDEEFDIPSPPSPYGIAGWGKDDAYVLIRDRYDLWKVDPTGAKKPQNFTRKAGRDQKIRFNVVRLDREQLHVDALPLLKGFEEESKEDGFYRAAVKAAPQKMLSSAHSYGYPQKAKNSDKLIWTRQDFQEFPNLWVSDANFSGSKKISDANPQQKDYLWGTVELVSWKAYDGKELQGMLYKPENFDPEKKYPMLVYFYEKSSNRLHRYSMPSPSRSIIYPSYYASNGYLVFIPDIVYETGQPGPDAYNAVVSGTEHLVKTHSFVDADRLGIQGQSWGGYQTAYIITKTNLYTAAMAGAPVSNMTSAYGGIRWGTGMSRMFQYERTQSRLGVTLWEDRERYINNSPVFFTPDIQTPVLMMHNDTDGAVPWYQGIEMFVALRRLNKPAWLLVYNKEAHNLRRWANRMDLSIRMEQFFNHYLKDAPAPKWMVEGLPALDKGKKTGYELVEKEKNR